MKLKWLLIVHVISKGIPATEVLVWLVKHSQIASSIMREHAGKSCVSESPDWLTLRNSLKQRGKKKKKIYIYIYIYIYD